MLLTLLYQHFFRLYLVGGHEWNSTLLKHGGIEQKLAQDEVHGLLKARALQGLSAHDHLLSLFASFMR